MGCIFEDAVRKVPASTDADVSGRALRTLCLKRNMLVANSFATATQTGTWRPPVEETHEAVIDYILSDFERD